MSEPGKSTPMRDPLPWDYFRCEPMNPDGNCGNCRRWVALPGQDYGPRTARLQVLDSTSEACSYMPISFLKESK